LRIGKKEIKKLKRSLESVLQFPPWPKKLTASSQTHFKFLFYLSLNAVVFSEITGL